MNEEGRVKEILITESDFDVAFEPDNLGGRFGITDEAVKDQLFTFSRLDASARRVVHHLDARRRNCFV